jgi:hypothetical protein
MEAAFGGAELGLAAAETAVAAWMVIAMRLGMIAAAGGDPGRAETAELRRMVVEKVYAFSEAGTAALREWSALQGELTEYALFLWGAAARGRPPDAGELGELAERSALHGLRLATSTIGASAVALAPVHRKATANARRLARRRARG